MRKMGIGLGVGINRSNYAQGIFNAYSARVVADGGVVESGTCVDAVSSLLQSASLLLIPSGYKGGKLYAEIPTNGNGDLTWTRGGDAFRTNESGVIQRVPWNLLQYSEQFDNGYWTKRSSAITSNAVNAPNGTLTADLMYPSSTGNLRGVYANSISMVAGTSYTWSVYAKASGKNWLYITCFTTTSDGAFFNLSTGVVGTVNAGVTATITNVGDGWYRCTATKTAVSSTTTGGPEFYVTDADNSQSVTASGTSGIYIWGAQLVEGTTAQTYLPTTDRLNFPRLSYMYGSCPSALLEPQRTNVALYSEQFDNAYWSTLNTTISANSTATLDPMGGNNADKFIANTTNGVHIISRGGFTSGAYSFTVYAKAGEETIMSLWLRNAFVGATFDLANGTVSNISVTSATITSVGNGWYRCFVYDSTAGTTAHIYGRSGSSYAGNGTNGFYIYGAQLEAGAYPTTYIPTTSATATRVADSFSRNNIYTNGLISASGGTWFVELRGNVALLADTTDGLWLGTSSNVPLSNGTIFFRQGGGSQRVGIWKYIGGASSAIYSTTTETVKLAIKWNGITADIFENGTKVVSATSFAHTDMEFLYSRSGRPTFIQQMALFPTPLTDAQCQTLTT